MRKIAIFIASMALPLTAFAKVYSVGLDKTQYTSDFMIGNVVVSVIFPESSGTFDANQETWSSERQAQVVSQIMAGLDWWPKQNPKIPLHFTVVSQTVATKYEPISRPYYDEALWIPDMMTKLGYAGTRFTATRSYANALRSQYNADWAFVIFVIDSLNDSNGKFADGLFGYAYLGGPFMVVTYDNNGYGISNMDVVVAHEVGHIFNALDEYAGASSPNDYSYGYFPTINGNHEYSSAANEPSSIMRGGIRWKLDNWARSMIGWRDNDNNGRIDIIDTAPTVSVSAANTLSGGASGFQGSAHVKVVARQSNSNSYGFTVDTIDKVEYRTKSGDWKTASANDGAFDSAEEAFQIIVPPAQGNALAVTAQDLEIRAITALSVYDSSGGGSGGGTLGAPATTLEEAHPYPNPFKPNSALGHTAITFAGLTDGAKVQIFTGAGNAVFEKAAAPGNSTLIWQAENTSGEPVSSGVYYYLITDTAGHKKKGKLAVIR